MATVKEYSLSRDGNKRLTIHFRVREFRCHDESDRILICKETVDILEAVRNYFGKPVIINSAYRTPSWNKKVGGASSSQHVKGTACDIRVEGVPSWAVAGFLEDRYPKHGIGYYTTFTHLDSRESGKSYWINKGSGNITVNTFRFGSDYTRYKAKQEPAPVEPAKGEEVTQAEFNKMYQTMLSELETKEPSNWKELGEAIEWAKSEGIVKGDQTGRLMMQKPMTRQEMVLMLYRANKK